MEEQTHTSTTGQPKKKQSGCATCLYLKSPSEQLQMKYALFPSSVDVLSGWPDFSNLLFIALLSLPCFPPLTLPLEFGRAAGQTPAPPAHRAPLLPLTHYGLSPSAWKPEWTSRETHPRPWESNQAPYTRWLSCELGLTPVPGESLGLLGEWVALGEARSDPPPPRAMMTGLLHQTRLPHRWQASFYIQIRQFPCDIQEDTQEDFFSQGLINPKHKWGGSHSKWQVF